MQKPNGEWRLTGVYRGLNEVTPPLSAAVQDMLELQCEPESKAAKWDGTIDIAIALSQSLWQQSAGPCWQREEEAGSSSGSIQLVAVPGPEPAQAWGSPHSPLCSGCPRQPWAGSSAELLPWGAPSSCQATLGRLGGLSAPLRDGGMWAGGGKGSARDGTTPGSVTDRVTKGPAVTRRRGREGQGVQCKLDLELG